MKLLIYLSLNITGTNVREINCYDIGSSLGGDGCGYTSAFDNPSEIDDWDGSGKEGSLTVKDGKVCDSGAEASFATFRNKT